MKLESKVDVDVNLYKNDVKRKRRTCVRSNRTKRKRVQYHKNLSARSFSSNRSPRKKVIDAYAVFVKFEAWH